MASFALKPISCFIAAVFCFSIQNVDAREGKLFFTKLTHDLDRPNNKKVALPPVPAPILAQDNGRFDDGPFEPGSGIIPQTKESWPVSSITTDEEFEKLMAKFEEEKTNKLADEFEEEEEEKESKDSKDYNEQKRNGYTYTTNINYDDNRSRRGYGDEEERQGMSDTRFMENGKYFDDDTIGRRSSENGSSRGYVSARGNDDPNEFETMEEYYKSLEDNHEYDP